ncbi:hypothetical protein KUTeg_024953 [Tegillarca granosa]|uniref:Plastocyanin-like domain-containing protein n=1 Tax=Tegillarca granosa TaxID=220873 RepID=A0ABQ9E4C3_TEGGR|nr:hypothetical protein KUTeg_024953 [Tegillarca granosa]
MLTPNTIQYTMGNATLSGLSIVLAFKLYYVFASSAFIVRSLDKYQFKIISKMFEYILVLSFLGLVSGMRADTSDYKGHPCMRKCHDNDFMTCRYNFTVEYYYTLSKACFNCPYNKTDCQRPHCVCKGDIVQVDVFNRMETGEGLAIHWHGLRQKGYQHMDGVDMITQCPIPKGSSFQYKLVLRFASYPCQKYTLTFVWNDFKTRLFIHNNIRDITI